MTCAQNTNSMYKYFTIRIQRHLYCKLYHQKKLIWVPYYLLEFIQKCCSRQDEWEIDSESLIIGDEKLGNGAFANVYKGTMVGRAPILSIYKHLAIELIDNHVAVKLLPPHSDNSAKIDFLNEMDFMKRLGYHSHIVSLLGCISDIDEPMLIVEYCSNGDMLRFLRRHRNFLTLVYYYCFMSKITFNINRHRRIDYPPNDDTDQRLYPKDLISFAWQISDGMVISRLTKCKLSNRPNTV